LNFVWWNKTRKAKRLSALSEKDTRSPCMKRRRMSRLIIRDSWKELIEILALKLSL
jgi:hypothetical protein